MKYLLDVSTLVALGVSEHEFHGRVTTWVGGLRSSGISELLTCSITELGFVRILGADAALRIHCADRTGPSLTPEGRGRGIVRVCA